MTTNGYRPPSETAETEPLWNLGKAVSLQEYQEGWTEVNQKFPSGHLNAVAKIVFNAVGNMFYKAGRESIDIPALADNMSPKLRGLEPIGTGQDVELVLKYMWELGLIGGVETHA